MADIKDVTDGMLRAWADCGVISSATYVEEVERRRSPHPRLLVNDAPPLDYAVDDELAIPYLHHDFPDMDPGPAGPMPPPPAVKWVALIAATLIIIALWMVL
ncbi:hypothetical protein NKG99_04055 [Mesorhizobium sp. M1409]|uniref:hypothetical protein n=1 Tax=Mesorhizobium sp. M1409 TaxID=2957100 RepID=UPI00333AA1F4